MTVIDDQRTTEARASGRLAALAGWFDPGEPHPVRGPFARWPRTTDGLVVVVVALASLVAVGVSALDDDQDPTIGSIIDRPVGAVALLGAGAVALWWRRSHPLAVIAAVLVGMVAWALLGFGDGHDLAMVVALYAVGRYHTDHAQSLGAVAAAAAVSTVGTIIDPNQRIDLVPAIVLAVLPWYVGRRVRNRGDYLALLQDRARRLEAEQQTRARQAVADERARIARELHDVVAHRVSMMTVQAGAAKTIARHDLDAAIEAMGDTERAGRQALGELRHLLGVLRPDDVGPDRLEPHPGLADVVGLVEELRRTGVRVDLTMTAPPGPVAAPVDLSAYRIVQESLTNVVKHAGPDPEVEVVVDVEDHQLVIVVTNTTATPAAPLPGSGHGLLGMTERAASLGGTLRAGPESPDRFRVEARLPLAPGPS